MPGTSEGIIVYATLDVLRKAIEKVLFDFSESCESLVGNHCAVIESVEIGDTIVFKENITTMPAKIIAAKIGDDQWYLMSSTEVPESGFPTTKDAMRVAAAETKKLKLIKEFLSREAGGYIVKQVEDWQPDALEDADRILRIIRDASKRYGH